MMNGGEPKNPLRIFLCHSSSNKGDVRSLYQQLLADGFEPWLDEENILPGQDWQNEVVSAIRTVDVVIVCLSRQSISRAGYFHKEIKHTLDVADEQPEGTIFLIPLKLEMCDLPDRLSRWHCVNLFEEKGYERLIKALRHREMMSNLLTPTLPERVRRGNQSKSVDVFDDSEEHLRHLESEQLFENYVSQVLKNLRKRVGGQARRFDQIVGVLWYFYLSRNYYTQEEVAARLGVPTSIVSKYRRHIERELSALHFSGVGQAGLFEITLAERIRRLVVTGDNDKHI
jgi:TIR domain